MNFKGGGNSCARKKGNSATKLLGPKEPYFAKRVLNSRKDSSD